MKTMIQEKLFALQDEPYRELTVKLNPSVDPDRIIGVRLPVLRVLAKELIHSGEADGFLCSLPHEYFDEYMLHALMLCEEKDFERALLLARPARASARRTEYGYFGKSGQYGGICIQYRHALFHERQHAGGRDGTCLACVA